MSDAMVMAWRVVRAGRETDADHRATSILRRDIASTVLEVAALGVMDSGIMAQAAIDRVQNASRFSL